MARLVALGLYVALPVGLAAIVQRGLAPIVGIVWCGVVGAAIGFTQAAALDSRRADDYRDAS